MSFPKVSFMCLSSKSSPVLSLPLLFSIVSFLCMYQNVRAKIITRRRIFHIVTYGYIFLLSKIVHFLAAHKLSKLAGLLNSLLCRHHIFLALSGLGVFGGLGRGLGYLCHRSLLDKDLGGLSSDRLVDGQVNDHSVPLGSLDFCQRGREASNGALDVGHDCLVVGGFGLCWLFGW
ncbi:hypothetical protein FR483_n212L [Paramecium bursaria Chlorella virus FR483]|uniref:Uncharacterized protein n212L n=1 Tax=Paramecium bursaria Chlorella virus FR483 TaxID=399781 RepID=A7J6R6_PBCVF|nr:hypothetical protein FR483_n212L [Paramecium bursaria Chlorella virus FR483]ABT15497.1 hypothetical protein FR483_n212L [Paramecium bursaria Chlorella virus FR483]